MELAYIWEGKVVRMSWWVGVRQIEKSKITPKFWICRLYGYLCSFLKCRRLREEQDWKLG